MIRLDARCAVAAMGIAIAACDGDHRASAEGGSGGASGGGGTLTGGGGSVEALGGGGPGTTANTSTGPARRPPGQGGGGGANGSGGAYGGGGEGGVAIGSSEPCLTLPDAETDPVGGHCYVDRTPPGGATHADARAICAAVAPGRSHLVTLGSDAEQSFVIVRFLADAKDTDDAWLGLACSVAEHPTFADCYCPGGCQSAFERSLATASWAWVDGTPTQFVAWAGASPDGAGRAAALGWSGAWGWSDRDETATSAEGRVHRVVCEIE